MFGNTQSRAILAKFAVATGAIVIMISGANAAAWQSSQAATQVQQSTPPPKTTDQMNMPGREEDFIKDVAQASQIEIESSKLAATKASSPEVKAFAEKLVKEHTEASAELMALVHAKRAMWPDDDPGIEGEETKTRVLAETHGSGVRQGVSRRHDQRPRVGDGAVRQGIADGQGRRHQGIRR